MGKGGKIEQKGKKKTRKRLLHKENSVVIVGWGGRTGYGRSKW